MALGLLPLGLIIALAAPLQGTPQHVDVPNFGQVKGFREQNVDCFLGIPFARPPVGDLRFQPPQPMPQPDDASKVTYDATNLPASCHQTIDTAFEPKLVDMWNPNTNMSEDCLYLNIWKPTTASNVSVMVWIYGGGFGSGSSTLGVYDGKILAAKGSVVVVSMQYRVGPLGFLSVDSDSAPGNAGLFDQQLALRWVHEHVAAFGGDPGRVTIFGESAGAASVSFHLLSPSSADLFQSAIMQSASPTLAWGCIEQEEAKERAYKLAELVECSRDNTVECLREKEPSLLTSKQWEVASSGGSIFKFVPVIDQKFLKKNPLELLKSGEFQRKNILLGMNSHEGSYFIIYRFPERFHPSTDLNKSNITTEEYRDMVKQLGLVESSADAVIDTIAYVYSLPCTSEGNTGDVDALTYFMALDGMFGDVWFKCPVVNMAKSYARQNKKGGNHKVFMYAFNHRTPGNPWPEWAGVALHGYEIDHVFGVPRRPDRATFGNYRDEDIKLSDRMIIFWTNFAKRGDPNQDDQDQSWPEYTIDDRQVLVLDSSRTLRAQTGLRDRYCQFWSELVPTLRTATGRATAMNGATSLLLAAVLAVFAVLTL